ncbi:MAG: thioredoxin [Candidatus Paceibacterota bacterium]
MTILTDENFEEFIAKADKPVLLDVFATWCPPCKMLSPIIEKIAEDYKEKIIVVKMDLDACPQTGAKFRVEVIPTVFFFKNGEVADKFVGFKPEEEIKQFIDNLI